jgi:hypothetical protein
MSFALVGCALPPAGSSVTVGPLIPVSISLLLNCKLGISFVRPLKVPALTIMGLLSRISQS